MRRLFGQKRFILFLSALSLAALALLASGLHDVQFQAGHALGHAETQTVRISVDRAFQAIEAVPVWKQLIFWVLLFLLVLLVSTILSPELRKRLIRMFIGFAVSLFAIVYLIQHNLLSLPDLSMGAGGRNGVDATGDLPVPVFTPPTVPGWVNFLLSLGLVLALLALAWGMSRWWGRLNRLRAFSRPLDDLALIARSSLDDMAAGSDWDEVIINCYARMSEAVSRKRGLVRKETMTPAEFARRLEQAGLPGDPVRRLTRLFESVRYGAKKSSQPEINEAVSCLTAILHYCGEAA
jgi:hypothetical protein